MNDNRHQITFKTRTPAVVKPPVKAIIIALAVTACVIAAFSTGWFLHTGWNPTTWMLFATIVAIVALIIVTAWAGRLNNHPRPSKPRPAPRRTTPAMPLDEMTELDNELAEVLNQ